MSCEENLRFDFLYVYCFFFCTAEIEIQRALLLLSDGSPIPTKLVNLFFPILLAVMQARYQLGEGYLVSCVLAE